MFLGSDDGGDSVPDDAPLGGGRDDEVGSVSSVSSDSSHGGGGGKSQKPVVNRAQRDEAIKAITNHKEASILSVEIDDVMGLLNSMKIEDAVDMVTSSKKLLAAWEEWERELAKKNLTPSDAIIANSYTAIAILPEAGEAVLCLAFALPGLAIGFAMIATATGVVYLINDHLSQEKESKELMKDIINDGQEVDDVIGLGEAIKVARANSQISQDDIENLENVSAEKPATIRATKEASPGKELRGIPSNKDTPRGI
ncbi:hypothetical protein N9X24_00370 [Rickettsiales bacterium]|nr:hypothetical protein [Rickettsiales bacterium]